MSYTNSSKPASSHLLTDAPIGFVHGCYEYFVPRTFIFGVPVYNEEGVLERYNVFHAANLLEE